MRRVSVGKTCKQERYLQQFGAGGEATERFHQGQILPNMKKECSEIDGRGYVVLFLRYLIKN
jgi:hypothetical protein